MEETLRLYICDDSPIFLRTMKNILLHYFDQYNRSCDIECFESGRALLNQWKQKHADVVFLDVDMPGLDGFDVAARLRESSANTLIVFVTNHDDAVYRIWDYKPFWFVRKSHLNDVQNLFPPLLHKLAVNAQYERNLCYLKNDTQMITIDLNLLVSIESSQHNLLLKDTLGNTRIFRCKIAEAEKQLSPFHILRVQKGLMVNCRAISKVTSREVILSDNTTFPIGRDRVTDVKNSFHRYLRGL